MFSRNGTEAELLQRGMPRTGHWESDDLVVAENGVKSTWSQVGHADQFMIVNFGTVVMAGIIKSDYDKIASFNSRD